MPCGKDWVDILAALLTPTIAVLGSVIAYLQWRTNRLRLKHELFEKRYAVYLSAISFIASIVQSGRAKEEERFKFLVGTKSALFLFPKNISDYLDEINSKACHLQCLNAELEGVGVGKERAENVKEQSDIKKWFNSQLEGVAMKFGSYINLQH